MIKKCSRCGAFKELTESNFRYMPKQDRYCAYCRPCEAKYTKEHRAKHRKSIFFNQFGRLTDKFSETEVDSLLNELKSFWRIKHG